jgi:hypothetical protein
VTPCQMRDGHVVIPCGVASCQRHQRHRSEVAEAYCPGKMCWQPGAGLLARVLPNIMLAPTLSATVAETRCRYLCGVSGCSCCPSGALAQENRTLLERAGMVTSLTDTMADNAVRGGLTMRT